MEQPFFPSLLLLLLLSLSKIKSSNGCGPNCSSIITTTTRKLSSKELTEGSVTHGDGMSFSSLSTSEPTSVSSTHFASIADFLESNSGTDSMKQNVSLSGKHNSTDNETSTASPDSTLLNNGTGSSDPTVASSEQHEIDKGTEADDGTSDVSPQDSPRAQLVQSPKCC